MGIPALGTQPGEPAASQHHRSHFPTSVSLCSPVPGCPTSTAACANPQVVSPTHVTTPVLDSIWAFLPSAWHHLPLLGARVPRKVAPLLRQLPQSPAGTKALRFSRCQCEGWLWQRAGGKWEKGCAVGQKCRAAQSRATLEPRRGKPTNPVPSQFEMLIFCSSCILLHILLVFKLLH